MATLIPKANTPAIEVGNVEGIRIAGFILEAGTKNSPALLQVGTGKFTGS